MFKAITQSIGNTVNASYFASILHHLSLITIKSDGDTYWNIIDLLVKQIVLQDDGKDVDIEKELLKLDIRDIEKLIEK